MKPRKPDSINDLQSKNATENEESCSCTKARKKVKVFETYFLVLI